MSSLTEDRNKHFLLFFYQSVLSTASPNPGVSTIVSLNLTPPSFISIVEGLICNEKHQMIRFTKNASYKHDSTISKGLNVPRLHRK